jgi:hypothetical protein
MRAFALVFAACVAAISFLATTRYGGEVSDLARQLPGRDVTGHFLLMGALAFFVVLGFADARIRGRTLGALGALGIVALGASIDEVLQLWSTNRTFSFVDLGASLAGIAAFGAIAAWQVSRRR